MKRTLDDVSSIAYEGLQSSSSPPKSLEKGSKKNKSLSEDCCRFDRLRELQEFRELFRQLREQCANKEKTQQNSKCKKKSLACRQKVFPCKKNLKNSKTIKKPPEKNCPKNPPKKNASSLNVLWKPHNANPGFKWKSPCLVNGDLSKFHLSKPLTSTLPTTGSINEKSTKTSFPSRFHPVSNFYTQPIQASNFNCYQPFAECFNDVSLDKSDWPCEQTMSCSDDEPPSDLTDCFNCCPFHAGECLPRSSLYNRILAKLSQNSKPLCKNFFPKCFCACKGPRLNIPPCQPGERHLLSASQFLIEVE